MKPYFETENGKLYHGDALEIMEGIPAGSVDLIFADPPYNISKADWDKIDNYHEWCSEWILSCCKVLKPNGAFWVSHSVPEELVYISTAIKEHGKNRINWITWDKYNGNHSQKGFLDGYTILEANRSFHQMAEYLICHADEGEWISQCDKKRGFIFEPIRKYLADEIKKSGIFLDNMPKILGFKSGDWIVKHYIERTQWRMPPEKHYKKLQDGLNKNNGGGYLRREYEDLRREYEDLRREYEDLRYTFNNPGKTSSVWPIPPESSWHPTTKPKKLMRRIINTTSNPGDLIFEPFGGSIPGCRVAHETKRKWMASEKKLNYCEKAKKQFIQETRQLTIY